MKLLGCLLLLAAGLAAGERMRYDNHKIVQFKIKNDEQLQQMMELEENNNGVGSKFFKISIISNISFKDHFHGSAKYIWNRFRSRCVTIRLPEVFRGCK